MVDLRSAHDDFLVERISKSALRAEERKLLKEVQAV